MNSLGPCNLLNPRLLEFPPCKSSTETTNPVVEGHTTKMMTSHGNTRMKEDIGYFHWDYLHEDRREYCYRNLAADSDNVPDNPSSDDNDAN